MYYFILMIRSCSSIFTNFFKIVASKNRKKGKPPNWNVSKIREVFFVNMIIFLVEWALLSYQKLC